MTELNFKGKEFVYNHHLAVPFRPLVPHPAKGVGSVALDGNLIVHGDNLHALKALLPLYAGKVDCIFIDPPYNTGNEGWSYNDNVNSPMIKEWLASNPIGIEDGLRHDKWCAMMWPRLKLLRELLADHGIIAITIDDHEFHRLEMMMDEIFGPNSNVATICVRLNPKGRHLDEFFAKTHEYVVLYARNISLARIGGIDKSDAMISEYDQEDARGKFRLLELRNRNSAFNPTTRRNLYFPIFVNSTTCDVSLEKSRDFTEKALPHDSDDKPTCWTWSKLKIKKDNKLLVGKQTREGKWRIFRKDYLIGEDGQESTTKPKTIWLDSDFNMDASRQALRQIMGNNEFDFPKPVPLVEAIINLVDIDDAVVLDSFAGSGTTAHAVLLANSKDGGRRRFILVESEKYADNLTAERTRRVINGYKFEGTEKTELFRESLTWRKLNKASDLIHNIQGIENLEGYRFNRIKREIKDGELVVIGEKDITKRTEGLSGQFTYCTLGEPVELDKILNGDVLPSFSALGAVLFHMATNRSFDPSTLDDVTGYLGETESQCVWLIYRDDLDWLKSPDAALTLPRAKDFAAAKPGKKHLVFAPSRFVSQKLLAEQNIPVEFVPLPFALYRIERE